MADRERRSTPPFGGVFVGRAQVLDADDVRRAIWRMAHEIIEANHGLENVVLIGLQTGGIPFAAALGEALDKIEGESPPVGTLDVAFHRDDIGLRPVLPSAVTEIPFDLNGQNNECGGIYTIAKPRVNMCFPPLSWQTYDIDFEAAKYDAEGKKIKNAIATVKHNGVLIHEKFELDGVTPGGGLPENPKGGPIQLQGHGNPVFYRNLWIVE